MKTTTDLTQILPTDHTRIANKLTFNYHTDASHGWLAVPNCLVRELGLAGQISEYSYMRGKTSYLEEDRDASLFVNAFLTKFGFEPKVVDLAPRGRSVIRSFNRFKMEAV
jgi:hypothetical protein